MFLGSRHGLGRILHGGRGWCPRRYLLLRLSVLGSSFPTRRGQRDEDGLNFHICIPKWRRGFRKEINKREFPDKGAPVGKLSSFRAWANAHFGSFSCITLVLGIWFAGRCFLRGSVDWEFLPGWHGGPILFLYGLFYFGGSFLSTGMFCGRGDLVGITRWRF